MTGTVEIDEVYIGGKEANKHEWKKRHAGRGAVGKQAVLGMRERGGRTKAMPVAGTSKDDIAPEIRRSVAPDLTIYADDYSAYVGLDTTYHHGTVKHSAKEYVNDMAHTNSIESVWAVLKRGYDGIYRQWSVKHMHHYVNEFTFRLNEGNCAIDTIDRIVAVLRGGDGKRLTYEKLVR